MKRFPELHSIWVENISKLMPVKFVPMKNSRLCSKHFSADMFEKGYSQRTVLKPYAVPTIFNDCFDQVGCVLFIILKYQYIINDYTLRLVINIILNYSISLIII